MKKSVLLLPMLLFAFILSAQTNFSGTWKLSKEKSQLNEQFSMAPTEIIVTQNGNEMKVEKHSSFQGNEFTISDKYTLDGIECVNEGMMDTKKISTVSLSEDKSVLTVTSKMAMQDGGEIKITEVYSMAGENMILDSSSSSSFGDMKEKMVYEKK